MRIPLTTRRAVFECMRHHVPFAMFLYPDSDECVFFADPGSSYGARSSRRFAVNSWCGCHADEYLIRDRAGSDEIIDILKDMKAHPCHDAPTPWPESTARELYLDKVDELIGRLRQTGGKTVISRTIASSGDRVDWLVVAERYFAVHPEAFRYMYYTTRHGFWLGASPEVLYAGDDHAFTTMALAGTRQATDGSEPWSSKNIAEQAIVRDYIVDKLYDLGLSPVTGPVETVSTGNLQHLRTVISGSNEGIGGREILSALNPTPALAGYPLAVALENIVETESHPRRCYGGYVAAMDGGCTNAYVNLRCVNFDEHSWCMYVGGGIMPDSESDDEWRETEGKANILRKIIEGARVS